MSGVTDEILRDQVASLAMQLQAFGLKLATAESCTGGWLAKMLTDLPGSSEWMDCGVVTYSNASKVALLGVTPLSLEKHGAVSEAVVREMVTGLLAMSETAQLGIAISGLAGPDGGTPDKPVGTVWFAWASRQGEVEASCQQFSGDRDSIRRQAVLFALQGLLGCLT